MSVFSATKLIKKPEKLPKKDSPKNDSEEIAHFQPSTSNDLSVGSYILTKHIADGTFGRVYEATDQRKQNKFAIKVVFFQYFLRKFIVISRSPIIFSSFIELLLSFIIFIEFSSIFC